MSITVHRDLIQGASDTEEWRAIDAYPDYAVSNLGRVKRVRPSARNHRVSGEPLKQCGRQYPIVTLCRSGERRTTRVNRLVCAAFNGPAPSASHHCAHNDGNPDNNRADNLRWATATENEADKKLHGTALVGARHWSVRHPEKRARGVGHGRAKLTPDAVRAIRLDARFQRVIAAEYGVSQRVIWMIKTGKTWGHVA